MHSKGIKPRNTAIITVAVIGSLFVMFVLVFGTVWMGQHARSDTEAAVRSVSLLYLEELAGRREQVVAENLQDRIFDMQTALELMTEEDLRDEAHRQAYQANMKALFSLEKFAFVDADGLIYTSVGVQNDLDEYSFDHLALTEAEISIKNLKSRDKKVIIAIPVDLMSEGKHLVVCFMEIDMEEMLSGVSMNAQESGATFCSIYTNTGVALNNTVLGGLAVEDNLLDALENAHFEEGYIYEGFLSAFQSGERGEISFTYNGIRETLAFVPVEGTNWLLTYLIRESVISDQISSISNGIIRRSIIQSALTVLILLAVFAYLFTQMRRNAKLRLERETSDAANRVKQQELEQRLVLQEKLLEEEKQRSRQDQMITAMASDYRSVYYVDIDADDAICIRNDPNDPNQTPVDVHFPYHARFVEYCEKYVDKEYQEGFLHFIDPRNVKEALAAESIIAYRYLVRRNGEEYYEMLRMAGVRHPEDRADHLVHAVGIGFTVIDTEMRESMRKNQALAEALKSAEEANKAKTAFLSNMSHEIRTPMNAIIGLDSLALRREALDSETREYLEKIGDSARHLLGLINDILDMSRIESGRLLIRKEEFSFSGMLEHINTMVMSQCSEKGLKYECHVIGGVSDYYIGDDMKLKQVLINILSNAIKFTDTPGSVTLTVERTAVYGDHSTVRFSVKDTGIGMDAAFIPRLFAPFTQEDSSRNNKYGSTGLGMSITRNIVELMNGTISVESEKGVGSEFTVVITLTNCDRQGTITSYINPKDMRILIVDDEEVAAEHARIVLDEVGIKAMISSSGREALSILEVAHTKHEPYNLVLLDWKMPGMDGLEVAREIRKRYDKETTVIILTAFNWDEILDEALHIGVDSFLAKPLFASNVIDEFERVARRNNLSLYKEKKRSDLKGRRILMAEDVLVNAEIIKQIIMIREAEIDHAENGRIVVEMFKNSPVGHYDAILMDVRMPEMDGLEATEAIRALNRPDAKIIPIIALTANAFDEDVQHSLQAGMNAHLSKPVEPEHLYQTMEELIWEADEQKKANKRASTNIHLPDVYKSLDVRPSGDVFFSESLLNTERVIYPDDRTAFLNIMDKSNMIQMLREKHMITHTYRLMIGDGIMYARLSVIWATDNKHLIIGVMNIDQEVRKEQEIAEKLHIANEIAHRDDMTGVKNKTAFKEYEENLQEQIRQGKAEPFAIVVCDLNGLKKINDTYGHKAGDEYIIKASQMICDIFQHSPVFRMGGDEFAVLLTGRDYLIRKELVLALHDRSVEHIASEDVVVSGGFSDYRAGEDTSFREVFERADALMYEEKELLKGMGAAARDDSGETSRPLFTVDGKEDILRLKRHILIVEDEKINQMILSKVFSEGYELLYASDGVEALEQVKTHKEHSCKS